MMRHEDDVKGWQLAKKEEMAHKIAEAQQLDEETVGSKLFDVLFANEASSSKEEASPQVVLD